MGYFFGASVPFRILWVLSVALGAYDNTKHTRGRIHSECLGNIVKFSLQADDQLAVHAQNGTELVELTPDVAAQCGYTLRSDPWGHAQLLASLQSCFTQSRNDKDYGTAIYFRARGGQTSEGSHLRVSKSCSYTWARREIICGTNFIEVSVKNVIPWFPPERPTELPHFPRFWKVVIFTPTEKAFHPWALREKGYGVHIYPTRFVMRSPFDSAETYSQEVNGVPMEVFKSIAYFKDRWRLIVVYPYAACPTGGVVFTEQKIMWHIPQEIYKVIKCPTISSDDFEILEMHIGIEGRRLDASEMDSRKYLLYKTESYIVIEIPIGAPDGYYKSHAPDNQYHITYTIEPMLELLWREGNDLTKYKVLFPITTPQNPFPLAIVNNTVPGRRVFDITLGTVLYDVALTNITFGHAVLTLAEVIAKGFKIQENRFPDGSKTYTLQVPFSADVVQKSSLSPEITIYTLPLIFNFVILPEKTFFFYQALLQTSLKDVVLPTVAGICDSGNFCITVTYGNKGHNFDTIVGNRKLTSELAQGYHCLRTETGFSLAIYFMAPDVAFESVESSIITGRIDVSIWDPVHLWNLTYFSLTCTFPATMADCFSNGTMTALVPKLGYSIPTLNPRDLTLIDPSCKPSYADDRFAYFVFSVSTCGTSRKFNNNAMVYENEVIWFDGETERGLASSSHIHYRFSISCVYAVNISQTLAFHTVPHLTQPYAEAGSGQLVVQIRLSKDETYNHFYFTDDYPVVKFLRQPLYFEVQLMESTDPRVEIVLENCWATSSKERASKPKWDLVIDSCVNLKDPFHTIFHPVMADARVRIPTHYKRFEIKMFSFAAEDVAMKGQVFVLCDVVICNAKGPTGQSCRGQCIDHQRTDNHSHNGGRRHADIKQNVDVHHVSSGSIVLH